MDLVELEKAFDAEMFNLYNRIKKEVNYTPSLLLNMISKDGGVATAKNLINRKNPSDGYTILWERGRLDLTVESIVLENPKWHPLFNKETLDIARRRLVQYK